MERETEKFVRRYENLFKMFSASQTSEEVAQVIYLLNGGHVLPDVVFQENGKLKDFDTLKSATDDMFRQVMKVNARQQIVCTFLNLNTENVKETQKQSPKKKQIRLTPNQRAKLMKRGITNSNVYFDSLGYLR